MVKLDRRSFIKRAGLGVGALCASSEALAQRVPRPNILWIISEDTSPDLGCYGNNVVRTSNFDRLASEGALFSNAFTTSPVCSPSRSAFMTGMYQGSIGAHQHRSHREDGYTLPEPARVVSEYFRAAGYFTSNGRGTADSGPGKQDFNFNTNNSFNGTDWSQRAPGQPFFAIHNIFLTHRKFVRDPENPIDPGDVDIPPYYPDHPLTRRDWADYLESIQVLDREVGEVLQRLEEDGLAENTIVLYFGDHGRCHVRGKQWLYEGGIHVPLIVRWPGVIEPGTRIDHLVSTIDLAPTCMALADIEIPDHLHGNVFLGENAEKREHIIAARDRCDETVERIRCVRTERYKYIRNLMPERPYTQFNAYKLQQYPVLPLMHVLHERGELTEAQAAFMAEMKPSEELYDLVEDPHETKNLVQSQEHRTTLFELREVLDSWVERYGDQGLTHENPSIIEYWRKTMAAEHEKWMAEKGLSVDATHEEHLAYWEKKML